MSASAPDTDPAPGLVARRVTIREVARLSGVSVGTVSNVLNGSPKVSQKTRRLVENAIDDLGFTPDSAARTLIGRRRQGAAETVSSRYAVLLRDAGLPPPDQQAADLVAQIVDEGSRGATRHLRLAHRLLIHLAGLPEEGEARWRRVRLTASFIMATRGADAPLIANGVAWLVRSAESVPEPDRAATLAARAEAWLFDAQRRLDRLVEAAMAVLGAGCRPVLLDYSSTVAAVIEALQRRGLAPAPILLESRATAGGIRYANQFLGHGIDIRLLPDMALDYALGQASAVLLGCESLRADGSIVNALGSLPLARLALAQNVPVHCCADLFKFDRRSHAGVAALRRSDATWLHEITVPEGRRLDTTLPLVEIVPSNCLTTIITDAGPLSPAALRQLGQEALEFAGDPIGTGFGADFARRAPGFD